MTEPARLAWCASVTNGKLDGPPWSVPVDDPAPPPHLSRRVHNLTRHVRAEFYPTPQDAQAATLAFYNTTDWKDTP